MRRPPDADTVYCARWTTEEAELEALDAEMTSAPDFPFVSMKILVGEPVRMTCLKCAAVMHILAEEVALGILDAIGERLVRHKRIRSCPSCGNTRMPRVLELFDW